MSSNIQKYGVVYQQAGLKNNLSLQWNGQLGLTNLASAMSSADRKVENYEIVASGNLSGATNDIIITDGGSGFALGDEVTVGTDSGTAAVFVVVQVDDNGGITQLLKKTGDTTNAAITVSNSVDVAQKDIVVWDGSAYQQIFATGDTIETGLVSPVTGSGSGATVLAVDENGDAISTADDNAGSIEFQTTGLSGYTNGDYIQVTGTNPGSGATLTTTADANGQLTNSFSTTPGSNYNDGSAYVWGESSDQGFGALIQCTFSGGGLQSVDGLPLAGYNYTPSSSVTITLSDLGGQAAIFMYVSDGDGNVYWPCVYGGLNYNINDTLTIQSNVPDATDLNDDTNLAITSVGTVDVNIAMASYFANEYADQIAVELRKVNGASTSASYITTLETGGALERANYFWRWGLLDCLQSLMLSMTSTQPRVFDPNGTVIDTNDTNLDISQGIQMNTTLSSASIAPYMFNAADDQTQVGIMMKNKALADYGEYLQNNARSWYMLLANLTYGPTTMFNINVVSKYVDSLNTLGNAINGFTNELDITYIQIRGGTYSVSNNADQLQASYDAVKAAIEVCFNELNTLRQALVA